MKRTQQERYRRQLEALAARVSDDARAITEQTMRASGGQGEGELSNAPMHLADMGTDEYLHDLNATLLENEEFLVGEAREALRRIEEGTFGACESCGEAIPSERLDALPYTRFCRPCAEKGESPGRLNLNVGRPQAPADTLISEGDLNEERSARRRSGFNQLDVRRTPSADRGDGHAAGTAGGGTSVGGLAGFNAGDGEPDVAQLEDATASGQFDAREDTDLDELSKEAVSTPLARQNRSTHRA